MKLNTVLRPLFENRIEFLVNQMGTQVEAAAREDDSTKNTKAAEIIQQLTGIDPSPKNKMMQFIVRMYANRQFKIEDSTRLRADLTTFMTNRPLISNKDINSYKSLNDLYDAIESVNPEQDVISNKQRKRDTKQSGAETVVNKEDIKIYKLLTKEAACFYGKGTKWCTTSENGNMYDTYATQGPLYVIIVNDTKGKQRKFQLHVETDQLMNERDQEISKTELQLISSFPEYTNFLNSLIRHHYGAQIDDHLNNNQ